MGFLVASGFFLRFWQESRDRLFALFAGAFLLLAVNRVLLVMFQAQESNLAPYVLRLLAFLLILTAIVDKNLRKN